LLELKDKPLIKVLTGMRRSGKSSLLKLYSEALKKMEIEEHRILLLNFESFQFAELKEASRLYEWLGNRLSKEKKHYILLDEIQEVTNWEQVVNSLMVDYAVDLVITGSNSKLLSSELATFLAGRYVEIPVFTLSFAETIQFSQAIAKEQQVMLTETAFENFLSNGGFPVLYNFAFEKETANRIVFDIYSSAILRDTVQRFGIRDVELLERLVRFIFDNIGQKFSAKSIADFFKSQQRKLDISTIYNYLNALESAFIIYRMPRYDIKGKELLKTQEKFFVSDHGLVRAVLGQRPHHISGILENIVAIELMRRGYKVFVGKLDDIEIDFIAETGDAKVYIQVTYRMDDPATLQREKRPLLQIADNYPKYILTMDKSLEGNVEGIIIKYLPEFLLD
nr:ATP-binding protein [Chitinophagaceae bacterium]